MLAVLYGSLVGLSLGLTGGGGAIIAVPLLIYGLSYEFSEATAISLAVVGATAIFGAILQSRKGHVLWLVGAILGCGGIPTVSLGKWIAANLPPSILLILFALLMTFIGFRMIFKAKRIEIGVNKIKMTNGDSWNHLTFRKIAQLLFFGGVVGILSGSFGIGGGFFLIPTLDLILGIPMIQATATSLVGIFLISVAGAIENREVLYSANKALSLQFFAGSALGMVLGTYAKSLFPSRKLEILFGCFVLLMAAFVLFQNLR